MKLALISLAIYLMGSTLACSSNETLICIDSKRHYKCTSKDSKIDHFLLLEKIQSLVKNEVLPSCEGGCTSAGCQDTYKPLHKECDCSDDNEYACTSLTTYKYCQNGTKIGDQHIECPDGEVCHLSNLQKVESPCIKESKAVHSLAMHCYHPINDTDEVVQDYSEFCDKHGSGAFLLPDFPICDFFIRCNIKARPNFLIEHCPPNFGFNIESNKCEPKES